VRIPADGTRALTLIYGIRPDLPCDRLITVLSAALHFTTFGVLSQTQQVPLGNQAVSVTGRCSTR
jgi:hypothetical protein